MAKVRRGSCIRGGKEGNDGGKEGELRANVKLMEMWKREGKDKNIKRIYGIGIEGKGNQVKGGKDKGRRWMRRKGKKHRERRKGKRNGEKEKLGVRKDRKK